MQYPVTNRDSVKEKRCILDPKPYRRKPKHSRRPPVWRTEKDYESLQDAVIETYLHHRTHDFGYTHQGTVSDWRKVYRRSASIHVNEGKSVTLISQEHVVRWNRVAQKHFLADETTLVRTIYLTSQNRIAFYFYDIYYNTGGKKVKHPVSPFDTHREIVANYFGDFIAPGEPNPLARWRGIAEEVLDRPVSLEAAYPGLVYFGHSAVGLLGPKVLRATTASEACDLIFGKSRHRKDLVRAVGKIMTQTTMTNRAHIIAWTELFKKSVPVDWLVLSLQRPHRDLAMAGEYEVPRIDSESRMTFRVLIDELKANERRNLLFNTHGLRQSYLFHDTIALYRQLLMEGARFPANRENVKNLRDLHDLLMRELNQIREARRRQYQIEMYKPEKMAIANEDLEYFAHEMEKDGRLDIRFARDYDTLLNWSSYMNNCISSYFTSSSLLAGVYDNGFLIANLEIKTQCTSGTNWRLELHQLLGKHNRKLNDADKAEIESFLAFYGVILVANRWA